MKKLSLLSLSCVVLASGAYANIMIDNFSDGARSVIIKSGFELHHDAATVIGGTRSVYVEVFSNPLNQDYSVHVADPAGFAIGNSGTLVDGYVELAYLLNDLNADMSGEDRFRFSFLSNDLPMDFRVWVRSSSSNGGAWQFQDYVIGANLNAFDYDVFFSDFATTDFSDIDGLAFDFLTSPSGDFALTQIEAVPEPATMLALGAGLAALAARRRRKA